MLPHQLRPEEGPGEPTAGGEAEAADAGAGGPATPQPFNRRVKMLVEVLDQPDEIALALQLFEERGWPARPATPEDRPDTEARYTALVVEVRLYGARRGACNAARTHVRTLFEGRQLDGRVRDAQLVRPAPRGPSTTYHVHRTAPADAGRLRRWLWRHWVAAGGADMQRVLLLPGHPRPQAAATELERRRLSRPSFDPATHAVRVAMGPRGAAPPDPAQTQEADTDTDTDAAREPAERRWTRTAVAGSIGVSLLLLLSGAALHGAGSGWWVLGLLPAAALFWPVGRWATGNAPQPALLRASVGLVFTGGLTFFGYLWRNQNPGPLSQQVAASALVCCGLVLAVGCFHALRHSWFARNANWLLPVLVPPLAFVLPVAGRMLHTVYLTEIFGIPAESVPVAFYWQFAVAVKPMAIAFAVVFASVGIAGWVRHFHWGFGSGREMMLFVWPLVLVVYLLTVVLVGLESAASAAERAASDARAGRDPKHWYGIDGRLVCVRPLSEDISVLGGPVPTGHPVLSFGASGDHVWLWDPLRASEGTTTPRASLRVRAEDVTITRPAPPTDVPSEKRCG